MNKNSIESKIQSEQAKMEKLVRNNIPDIITADNRHLEHRIANDTELEHFLFKKLYEEVTEVVNDKNEEELTDVLEVVGAIRNYLGFTKEGIAIEKNNIPQHYLNKEESLNNLQQCANQFNSDRNVKNLANVLHAIDSIILAFGFSKDKVEQLKAEKRADKGGFDKK